MEGGYFDKSQEVEQPAGAGAGDNSDNCTRPMERGVVGDPDCYIGSKDQSERCKLKLSSGCDCFRHWSNTTMTISLW